MQQTNRNPGEATIGFFRQNGFAVLPSLMRSDEIESLVCPLDRALKNPAAHEDGMVIDYCGTRKRGAQFLMLQILEPLQYADELAESPFYSRAERAAQALLGCEVVYRGSHAIRRPAGCRLDTPWHQDEAYWDPSKRFDTVSVWLPLRQATEENGCMEYLPGSHQFEVLPHHRIDHNPEAHGLEVDPASFDPSAAVRVPVPLGAAIAHHSRTLHRARPNMTSDAREVLVLVFGREPEPRHSPRNFPWQEASTEQSLRRRQSGKSHY